jgi:hypothetical protein
MLDDPRIDPLATSNEGKTAFHLAFDQKRQKRYNSEINNAKIIDCFNEYFCHTPYKKYDLVLTLVDIY